MANLTCLFTTVAFNTESTEIKNKILDVTDLTTKAFVDIISTEIQSEIPDITNLATKAPLNTKAA